MRNLDLASLDVFRAVVREGGVVRASSRLNRVQSNITTRIKQLEQKLGVALFRKQGRSLVLTEAGRTLLGYSERLLRLAEEAEHAVLHQDMGGVLRIGSMESTAASRLPPLLSAFHRAHPQITIELETGTSRALVGKVRDHQLDAAFVGEPFEATGLAARPVFTEELVLVTGEGQGPVKHAGDLAGATLLVFAQGCSYRRVIESWFAADGVVPARIIELGSYHAIIACAAAGTGCGIVPASVLDVVAASRHLARHPLPEGFGRNRTHLIWRAAPSLRLDLLMEMLPAAPVRA